MSSATNSQQAHIIINVDVNFSADESAPEHSYWVYHYHISLHNTGTAAATLLTRHWVVTDGEEKTQEVHGEGVVGRQPYIRPSETYQYSSRVAINTPVGSMHGSYQMIDENGNYFEVAIPAFTLALPNSLH